MSLADYADSGSWMKAGTHDVSVRAFRTFDYNTGNPGVEFTLADSAGRTIKTGMPLTEKALWKLASFAQACGMTKEQLRTYDPHNPTAHRMLVNKRLRITIEKPEGSKYHEVADWEPIPNGRPTVQTPQERPIANSAPPPQQQANHQPPTEYDDGRPPETDEYAGAPSGNEIPF